MTHPKVVIHMLGQFEVFRDGVKVAPAQFGSRKARVLLRWLADARNSVVPIDVLLDALWPDIAAERIMSSLRVRISELRKLLSPTKRSQALLERVDNGYTLRTIPGTLEVDVDRFEKLASEALQMQAVENALQLLKQCVDIYKGDYLSDDPYTVQWYSARERYRQIFVSVIARLAKIYEFLGQYEEGILLLQRLLGEPHRDEGHYRALIRLQYLNGDQAGALRTFQECRSYLESEYESRPTPQTMRLLKQVIRHEPLDSELPLVAKSSTYKIQHQPTAASPIEWPFLGRQAELAQLEEKIATLRNGQGGTVWLHGPSGIGKTRLLREAINNTAQDRGFRTLWIQGSYLDSRIPFAATLDGLQTSLDPDLTSEEIKLLMKASSPHLQQLTGWFPGMRPKKTRPPGSNLQSMSDVLLRQEFLRLFERLSQQMPLFCCVDDVHALDSASRALLLALARRAHKWPLLIIATSRRVPQQIDVGNELLHLNTQTAVISLKPLSPAALRPLVGSGVPSPWTRRWLRQLHTKTAGDPLMLTEKLHGLRRRNLIDLIDGQVVFPMGLVELLTNATATDIVPERLYEPQDEFQEQWDALDDTERSLLQKAAALRDSLTLDRLKQLATKPPNTFQRVLEQLIRKGYLTVAGSPVDENPRLSFTHSRIRHRTYHTIARSERIWYHQRIFELLQAEAVKADEHSAVDHNRRSSEVAFHALLAEKWEAAARWSLRAAAVAKAIMPGPEVVALCRQAFRAAQRTTLTGQSELLNEARWALADALFYVGSYNEAAPLFEALVEAPNVDTLSVYRHLITTYLHLHRVNDAQTAAEQLLMQAGDDKRAQGRAHLNLADVHYRLGDLSQAIAQGKRALDNLRGEKYRFDRAETHRRMGLFLWDLGEYGSALEHTEASVKLDRSLETSEIIESLNQLGELYQDLFCTTYALKVHREALTMALEQGRLVLSIEISRNIGFNYVHQGRTDKGIKMLERAWQQAQDLDLDPYWQEVHLRSLLEANILAHRPNEVRKLLTQYEQVIGPRETPFVTIFLFALAFLEGRIHEGEALLAQAQTFWQQTGRRARATHVLLFAGQELMLHGYHERANTYLRHALEEMERICTLVPAHVAQQIRMSRQHLAAQHLVRVITGS